jgi:secondary thiamine-phosphate synthase enzyme
VKDRLFLFPTTLQTLILLNCFNYFAIKQGKDKDCLNSWNKNCRTILHFRFKTGNRKLHIRQKKENKREEAMEFGITTSGRSEFVNITHLVQKTVSDSGIMEGFCTVFIPHTTAAVTINEGADPDVMRDINVHLEKAVPWNANYSHMEGNSAAHIKSSFFGCSENIIIERGHLKLGTWQKIYFCEFDGPRSRKVWVQVIGK